MPGDLTVGIPPHLPMAHIQGSIEAIKEKPETNGHDPNSELSASPSSQQISRSDHLARGVLLAGAVLSPLWLYLSAQGTHVGVQVLLVIGGAIINTVALGGLIAGLRGVIFFAKRVAKQRHG